MTSEERREGRYRRRQEKRRRKREERSASIGSLEDVFSFRNLFMAGKRCCNGVRWKQSTQNFELHLFSGTAIRRRAVLNGTWKPGKTVHFTIHERGKVRPIDAPHINDRQIHKVLTEKVLSPLYIPSMIHDNGASQRGKGLHFHVRQLKEILSRHYRRYGTAGAVVLADYHSFFPSAPHEAIKARHARLILDDQLRELADRVVDAIPGGVGMPLGVEPSQQEMVALPSGIDSYMACQERAAGTGHYMDDYHFMAPSIERGREILARFTDLSGRAGLEVSTRKCKVIPAGKPFRFCKMKFQLTDTGRIITHGCRDGMKRARRKMKLFRKKVAAGETSIRDVELWLQGQVAYYDKFNDHGRIVRLKRLYHAIFERGKQSV